MKVFRLLLVILMLSMVHPGPPTAAAAEGGHVTVDYRSRAVCNCGVRGCIEALASGTAMARRATEMLPEYPETLLREPVTAEDIGRGVAQQLDHALAGNAIQESAVRRRCE